MRAFNRAIERLTLTANTHFQPIDFFLAGRETKSQVQLSFKAVISSTIAAHQPGWDKASRTVLGMDTDSNDAIKEHVEDDKWLYETKWKCDEHTYVYLYEEQ